MIKMSVILLISSVIVISCRCQDGPEMNKKIEGILEKIRLENNVPAIGAAIIKADGGIYVGVSGKKNSSSHLEVTPGDHWHIGSCSKALTSTLAAQLVEQKKLEWTTKLGEIFPDETSKFKNAIGRVNILQLLSHRSGIKRDFTSNEYMQLSKSPDMYYMAFLLAGQDEDYLPDTSFSYSNVDYILVAAVIERISGTSYENNIKGLFHTINIGSAAFADEEQESSSIWPHDSDGRPLTRDECLKIDYAVKRPAGGIRMGLKDWAAFILDNLRAYQSHSSLLPAPTYRKLHTPVYDGDYGMGWIRIIFEGDTAICHTGSNGYNLANVHMYPAKGYAILVCTNQKADDFRLTSVVISGLRKMMGAEAD